MAPPKHRYAVIIDAGSSGSRAYVYEYKTAEYVKDDHDTKELGRLPKVKTKKHWHKKIHPGISTFGETPELVGDDHLKDLVKFAEEKIDKDDRAETPIFLLATAGMRLLPDYQCDAVLKNTCTYLQQNSPFLLPDCALHIQVIPGETEGLYGWIAANYLLGGFDKPDEHVHANQHSTYGFLDMGGASAQIAFAPNATEAEKHADDLKLLRLRRVNGEQMEYGVFVTTWLGFGVNEARRRYVEHLVEAYSGEHEIPDPCLPVGLRIKQSGEEIEGSSSDAEGKEPILVGTGRFPECLDSTFPLLEKTKSCEDPPCLLNGVHTPAIDFDVNHFVGVSEYWHTTHEIFAMAHKDKAYDFHTYQKQVTELCSRDWTSISADVAEEKWGHKVDEETVEEVCFKASWLINMLHDGIGIPRMGKEHIEGTGDNHSNQTDAFVGGAEDRGFLNPFQAVDEIDGTDVSWTLGKMLLYASSQMPPADGAMAVGFGSNMPGTELPEDFQYPSGQPEISAKVQDAEDGESQDWHERILSSSYSRRIGGIVIVLLIVVLVIYFLFGRDRRIRLWQKITGRSKSSPGRPRPKRRQAAVRSLSTRLFGSGEPAYERVLEDAEDPVNVELTDTDNGQFSDSSSGGEAPPRTGGRTSGWDTPTAGSMRGVSPEVSRSSPRSKGYFDSVSSTSSTMSNPGLGISPFERGGLMARAESTDRLDRLTPASSLRRSRTSSPRRSPLVPFVPPLSPFKENVE